MAHPAGSSGRSYAPVPAALPVIAQECADELWHEQPRPVLRAAGAPGPARGRVDAGGVRQRIGYDPGQISRIENGKRPPTELFAQMCDRAFPDRDGWFGEFYAESRTWIATPPWFRSWVEHEQQAATLRIWQLGVLSGLLQTEQYARGILTVEPGVTDDQVSERLAARLARQVVLTRDDPPAAWFLVDEAVLHRCVGSAHVMAAQLAHLVGLARLPNVAIQVVPTIAHAGLLGGFAAAERRLRRNRGRGPGIRGRRHHCRTAQPFRYAQERGAPGVGVPGLDRADVHRMDSN